MITTDFIHGAPCWIDLGAPDVGAAATFYSSVFGWKFDSYGRDPVEYGTFKLDGKVVGGVGKLTEKGARSAWMIYFTAPDVDAAAETAKGLGGTVRSAPTDAQDMGRMVQLTDPQGGQFALWQAGKSPGFEVADEPGSLSWTELYTTDAAGAKAFYGGLFGWKTDDMPLPGDPSGTYSIVTPAGADQNHMLGGIMQLPAESLGLTNGTPYWHPVFAVADTDAAIAAATAHGGTIQMGPEDAQGVGRLAVCLDPFGADFVVLTPSES